MTIAAPRIREQRATHATGAHDIAAWTDVERGAWWRDVALVAAIKIVACGAALWLGFRAVSDDDFARTVIAEQWARAPKLDASGTSWLPLPFWVTGSAMALFGRSLTIARALAFALGLASSGLVYVAGRWITGRRDAALAGAIVAAIFPWSARLGVATVPELPTAALGVVGIASSVAPVDARRRLLGAFALLAATLSRYEVWPIAALFSGVAVADVWRSRSRAGWSSRAMLAVAAVTALIGPAAWLAWNRHAHGDALHFLARVSAYRRALGAPDEQGVVARLFAYPLRVAVEEPELVGLAAVGLLAAIVWWRRGDRDERAAWSEVARSYALPMAMVVAEVVALSAALVRDGAPTHHPERAMLIPMLLIALGIGSIAVAAAPSLSRRGRAAFAAVVVLVIASGGLARRSRAPSAASEATVDRAAETAIGQLAGERTPPGEHVLVEAADYGFFAIVAAFGRPEDTVVDRSLDPRSAIATSSFDDEAALLRRIADVDARAVVARVTPVSRGALGDPAAAIGGWALWHLVDGAERR